ncbi:MAG: type IV toxin-antitoxin system AbiEi family antitoxin domain-containing protein [Acidimicrobiia bacterium]
MNSPLQHLSALAARQHGVVCLSQVQAAGVSSTALSRHVAAGRLVRIAPKAFLLAGAPPTWKARLLAECRSAGSDAVVSHRSAAVLWRLDGFDPPRTDHLSLPRGRRPQARPNVRFHLSADLALAGRTYRDGIAVTGIPRTIIDLCASEPNRAVTLRAIDSARKQGLVSWGALRRCVDLHARPGRRGVALLRELIDLRDGQDNESWLQDAVFELLVAAGLPRPEREVEVSTPRGRFRIDIAYRAPKIGIECKGKADHLTDAAFEADPVREIALGNAGWRILCFTRFRYLTDPAGIVADVAAALRAAT